MILILKMSILRDLALINLTSNSSKEPYPVQAEDTKESILKPYWEFIMSQELLRTLHLLSYVKL